MADSLLVGVKVLHHVIELIHFNLKSYKEQTNKILTIIHQILLKFGK